jgi:hypothetical protein
LRSVESMGIRGRRKGGQRTTKSGRSAAGVGHPYTIIAARLGARVRLELVDRALVPCARHHIRRRRRPPRELPAIPIRLFVLVPVPCRI